MNRILLLTAVLVPFLLSCATQTAEREVTCAQEGFSESCHSCGTPRHYAYSWTDEDYGFLRSALSDITLNPRSPHGPTPACSSTYSEDTSYRFLKSDMPRLKRSTFQSFLAKNQKIAVHSPSVTAVKVAKKSESSISRPGFSSDGTQTLVFDGRYFTLYELINGEWRAVEHSMAWIS